MRIKRILINILIYGNILLLFFIFSSCKGDITPYDYDYIYLNRNIYEMTYTDMQTLKEKDNISEAIIRYMIVDTFTDTNVVYFLSIGKNKEDPSDEFINRFKQDKLIIRKISENVIYNDISDTSRYIFYLYIKGYRTNIFNTDEIGIFYTEESDYEYGHHHLDIILTVSRRGNNWYVRKGTIISNIGPI